MSLNYKPKTKPANWMSAFPPKPVNAASKPIRSVSERQAVRNAEYAKAKREWWRKFNGSLCIVARTVLKKIEPVENKPHHIRGRAGKLLCDTRYWLACSREGHEWIHQHPAEAVTHGWLAGKGQWGRSEPDVYEILETLHDREVAFLARQIAAAESL